MKEARNNLTRVMRTVGIGLIIACLLASLNTVFAQGKTPPGQSENSLKPVHSVVSSPGRFNPHTGLTPRQQEIAVRTSISQTSHQIHYKDHQTALQPSQRLQSVTSGPPGFKLLPVDSKNLSGRPDRKPRDHNFTEPPRPIAPSPAPPQDRIQPPGTEQPAPGKDRREDTKPVPPITRRDRQDDRAPTEINGKEFKRRLEITKAIRVNVGQNWYYDRPICREGYYYYSSLDCRKPFRYGYWVFDRYDQRICRKSIYFYYGRLPYILVTRVYVLPYVVVSYTDTPVVLNDYYLARRDDLLLQNTLAEIRDGWLYQKSYLITTHVRGGTRIAVFLDGKYEYSIDADDYAEMTADAISEIDTISFTWQTIKKRTDGAYTAFARHVYKDSNGTTKTVYVSYTLRMIGNDFYIEEVGASKAPLG